MEIRKGKYYSEESIKPEAFEPSQLKGELEEISYSLFSSLPEYPDRDYPSYLDEALSKIQARAYELAGEKSISLNGAVNAGLLIPSGEKADVRLTYEEGVLSHLSVIVEKGASLTLTLSSNIEVPSYSVLKLYLSEGAEVKLRGFHAPKAFFEERILIFLEGENSHAREDRRFYAPSSTFRAYSQLTHISRKTFGRSEVRGALGREGKGSIEGMIKIMPGASGTDSYLTQKTLVLEEGGKAYTYPSLEIENNDVRASHSSLTAFLSEEDLFYLQSRGIPEERAKVMLTAGFLSLSEEEFLKLQRR